MARIITALILTLIFITSSLAMMSPLPQTDTITANFSGNVGSAPTGWEQKDLKNKVKYTLVSDKNSTVLQAESRTAASGLFKQVTVDPKQHPFVSWEWKVSRVPAKGDERKKDGDDCAARTFVIFKDALPNASAYSRLKHKLATTFSSFVPAGVAICYVWSNKIAKDEIVESPFTDWVKVVAVESGSTRAGEWVTIKRNILEDYRKCFNGEPTQVVGVAVMTDTDQTGETITTLYRDIIFKKQ